MLKLQEKKDVSNKLASHIIGMYMINQKQLDEHWKPEDFSKCLKQQDSKLRQ
jgi:hypothetical protein